MKRRTIVKALCYAQLCILKLFQMKCFHREQIDHKLATYNIYKGTLRGQCQKQYLEFKTHLLL